MTMIDWTKPIEIVYEDGVIEAAECKKEGAELRNVNGWYPEEDGKIIPTKHYVRNVAEHPMPEPTATWWARRWYDSASPDEREAMRVILAGEG